MELKDFIENSLMSIIGAVNNTQIKLKDTNVIINPSCSKDGYLEVSGHGEQKVTDINFDVAIAIEDKEEGVTKGGITVLQSIGIGGKKTDSKENRQQTRIQFSVPVVLPVSDNLTEEAFKNQHDTIDSVSSMI